MNKTKQADRKYCVVCGARCRHRLQDTCDSLCTRAKRSHRNRGEQADAELRWVWTFQPIETNPSLKDKDLDYNRPYMRVDSM